MIAQASKVSKSFGGIQVFEEIDFGIKDGDTIALIGENGCGKSTLFRLLAGQLKPDAGNIAIANEATVGYMMQEPAGTGDQSVLEMAMEAVPEIETMAQQMKRYERQLSDPENSAQPDKLTALLAKYDRLQRQFEAAGGYTYEHKVLSVLSGLGFSDDQCLQAVNELSGGEKKLVALAQLLIQEPDILLLDEPDNHLDIRAKQWLQEYIQAHRGAVAIISHDRYFLDTIINHIFELEDGRVHEYYCNYSGFLAEKQRRLEREAQLYELQKRELKALKRSAERLTQWAKLNDKFAKRAQQHRRRVEKRRQELHNTALPILDRRTMQLDFGSEARSGKMVLELENVSMSYGNRQLFAPFGITVRYGERIGIVGPNGCGKSTLFKIILEQCSPSTGSLRYGARVVPGYYSQEQESLEMDATPLELVRSLQAMYEDRAIALLTGKLLFTYEECRNVIGNLSGGQKSRLQLLQLSLQGVNLLLLDEPTNNLDIPSMIVLESALMDFEGTIITISHDRYFLDEIVESILAIDQGKISRYPGNFSEFYERTGGTFDLGTVGHA